MRLATCLLTAALCVGGSNAKAEEQNTPPLSPLQKEHLRVIVDQCFAAVMSKVREAAAGGELHFHIIGPDHVSRDVTAQQFLAFTVYQCAQDGAADDPLLAPLVNQVSAPVEGDRL